MCLFLCVYSAARALYDVYDTDQRTPSLGKPCSCSPLCASLASLTARLFALLFSPNPPSAFYARWSDKLEPPQTCAPKTYSGGLSQEEGRESLDGKVTEESRRELWAVGLREVSVAVNFEEKISLHAPLRVYAGGGV